jgi:hypothetical protein
MIFEEARFIEVISDSKRKLVTLQLLDNFFENVDFLSVLIRTKVIHNLFENNRDLDINKLELFHIQYTNSLIELFQKLKKSKEQLYLVTSNEIYINDDFIKKISTDEVGLKFPELMRKHSQVMIKKLEHLYKMFSHDIIEVFSWDEILKVSNMVQTKYYREITIDQYSDLISFNLNFYQNVYAKIERKLLGKLNACKFRVKFTCGLECNNELIEVYDFIDSNEKFIFVTNDKSFILLDSKNMKNIDLSKNISSSNQIVSQLIEKNEDLKEKLSKIKTSLTKEILDVLKSYLDKISTVDFLDELQNVDEQTNILKAMLNVNINSK